MKHLKWKLVRLLGERGRAAAYWAGNKDNRAPGTDAFWYDTRPYQNLAQNYPHGTDIKESHIYLTMRDGVKIAISLYQPGGFPSGEKLPTLINQTCYWRCFKIRWPYRLFLSGAPYFIKYIVPRGYNYIIVDVRGTGASFGDRPFNRVTEENRDFSEILEWAIRQPWSDGKVVTEGVSYMGATASIAAANKHPGLVAAIPQYAVFDTYEEFYFPGGILCERIIRRWSDQARKMQRGDADNGNWFMGQLVTSVMPVDKDRDQALLNKALLEHRNNGNTYEVAASAPFRDSPLPGVFENGKQLTHNDCAPYVYSPEIEESGVPMYSIGGWFDGAFIRGTINRYLRFPSKGHKLVIGPWDHGGAQNISPWSNSRRSASLRLFELLRFTDHHSRNLDTGINSEAPVHYFTMGEEKWKASDTWPPTNSQLEPYFFSANGHLDSAAPDTDDQFDRYQVDFSATSGINNRWQTIANFGNKGKEAYDIEYPDRAGQQQKLQHYTTPPLNVAVEVTGHPILTLYMSSTATDGAIHVYLEDVGPDGDVVYVTEGLLRASRRKISQSPYPTVAPYHSHFECDSEPLRPGEIAELRIELFPTSYLFAKGRSIRVGLAGADKDTFEQIPAGGKVPVLDFYRDAARASKLDLPIVRIAHATE